MLSTFSFSCVEKPIETAEDVDKSVVESCPRLRFPKEELVADGGGMLTAATDWRP